MSNRIIRAAILLVACAPAVAAAQQHASTATGSSRMGSWEFTVGGGVVVLDPSLRDFLASGVPESRFANSATISRGVPAVEARLGYAFTRYLSASISGESASGSGVHYLTPAGSITLSGNIDARTIPFLLVGTELTRISGENDRVTHSTWGAHVGIGVRQMLSQRIALRLEGDLRFEGYNEVPMTKHSTTSPVLQLGLSWFAGGWAH